MIFRLVICFQFFTTLCFAQTDTNLSSFDSICIYGNKYEEPQKKHILFPSVKVSYEYKIEEIHVAIPESYNNDTSSNWWLYQYFYKADIYDYNPKTDSIFIVKKNLLLYKLKDTYFMDINGDGKLDFIHYPLFYKSIMLGNESYDIFINQVNNYKKLTFRGFINSIKFNNDGTLNSLETYQHAYGGGNYCVFYKYEFNKHMNELILIEEKEILLCQLINWPYYKKK